MRYYIIFGITLILTFIILFYNPYLGIYENNVTISYDYNMEGYTWSYTSSNDNLLIINNSENSWTFKTNKNGKTKLIFKYSNSEDTKYTIEYIFKIKNNKIYWLEGVGYGLLEYPNPT